MTYKREILERRRERKIAIAEEKRRWRVLYYNSDGKPDKRRRPGRPWDPSLYAGPDKQTYTAGSGVDLLAHTRAKGEDERLGSIKSVENTLGQVSLQSYLEQVNMYEQLLEPIQRVMRDTMGGNILDFAQPSGKEGIATRPRGGGAGGGDRDDDGASTTALVPAGSKSAAAAATSIGESNGKRERHGSSGRGGGASKRNAAGKMELVRRRIAGLEQRGFGPVGADVADALRAIGALHPPANSSTTSNSISSSSNNRSGAATDSGKARGGGVGKNSNSFGNGAGNAAWKSTGGGEPQADHLAPISRSTGNDSSAGWQLDSSLADITVKEPLPPTPAELFAAYRLKKARARRSYLPSAESFAPYFQREGASDGRRKLSVAEASVAASVEAALLAARTVATEGEGDEYGEGAYRGGGGRDGALVPTEAAVEGGVRRSSVGGAELVSSQSAPSFLRRKLSSSISAGAMHVLSSPQPSPSSSSSVGSRAMVPFGTPSPGGSGGGNSGGGGGSSPPKRLGKSAVGGGVAVSAYTAAAAAAVGITPVTLAEEAAAQSRAMLYNAGLNTMKEEPTDQDGNPVYWLDVNDAVKRREGEVNAYLFDKRRKAKKSNRRTGKIPWELLDQLDGETTRFDREKAYVDFNKKY